MRNLAEAVVAADRLQEFGAAYVNQEDFAHGGFSTCIPHSYWDRLSAAITMTAKEFLDKQQVKGFTSTLCFLFRQLIYNLKDQKRKLATMPFKYMNCFISKHSFP